MPGSRGFTRIGQKACVAVTDFRRACRSLTAVAVATAGAILACRSSSPPADSAWIRDSTAYQTELARWRADSAVRDSVSRLVNTDSLYRLYRSMLSVKDPHSILQERACERLRLAYRFGVIPVDLAVARMEDTVGKGIALSDLRRLAKVKERIVEVNLSREICGIQGHPGWTVNGVDLNSITHRPIPPRR